MSNATITSRPFKPVMACERCVFQSGPHADWCPERWVFVDGNSMSTTVLDKNKFLTGRDAYNAIFNAGAQQRSDAFIEYWLGSFPNEPPAGPWADLFAGTKPGNLPE